VDLVVIGAPSPRDRALAWWRSVASEVTSSAACSVHVVRASTHDVPSREDALTRDAPHPRVPTGAATDAPRKD